MTPLCFMGEHHSCRGCNCSCHARSLFDEATPYQRHSDTSYDAAMSILPEAGTLKAQVYDLLRQQDDGLTDEEGITALDMNPSTYRPRRIDLVDDGMVMDSGRRRRTKSGRMAVVWVARS